MNDNKPDAFKELMSKYPKPDYLSDLKALGELTEKEKERQADKAALLQTLEAYYSKGLGQAEAVKRMRADYANRIIEPRLNIHQRIKAISRASLLRWRKQVKEHGWAALAGDYRSGRQGYFYKHPEALKRLASLRQVFPEASIIDICKAFCEEIQEDQRPTLRQVATALKNWGI